MVFFTSTAKKLTQWSGNRLNFFNVGGLVSTRTQHSLWGLWTYYSWREYFTRFSIVSTMLVMAYIGANTENNNHDDYYSYLLRGALGGLAGFLASHLIVVAPTMYKRHKLNLKIKNLVTNIDNNLNTLNFFLKNNPTLIHQLHALCQKITKIKRPLEKKGDAARNLIMTKIALDNLDKYIDKIVQLQGTIFSKEALEIVINDLKTVLECDTVEILKILGNTLKHSNIYSLESDSELSMNITKAH